MDRSRLSHIERGYVHASDAELARILRALDELRAAKKRLLAVAMEVGWPTETI
jgi:hypothetical protein